MRMAIDARELFGQPTGVGRYLANLLAAWAAMPEARRHRYVLYQPAGSASAVALPSPPLEILTRSVPGASGTWWEQTRLPLALRRDRPDVLFAPAYSSPVLAGLPVVLTIHDLSFLVHPEWFRWRERVRRRWLTTLSARRAQSVLTDSQFSKTEIVRLLGVPADRVRVIPLAPSPLRPAPAAAADARSGAESPAQAADPTLEPAARARARDPLVLYVGSVFNRRRLRDLIKAFAVVARTNAALRLEIVGDNRTHPHEDLPAIAASAGVADRVGIRPYVSDAALADLYSRAAVFAFLSEYEGFGLTPLEALAHGVPPVVLDTAVAREVYGDAAVFVPKDDVDAAADAIRALLCDADARAAIFERAPAVLGRYSWERTARDTLAAIESAARQVSGSAAPARADTAGGRRG